MKNILQIENLSKKQKKHTLLNDVSLTLPTGQITGLLGPNGAGKTTLFHTIMGLYQSDTGTIVFCDQNITHLPTYKRARLGLSYLSQEPSIFNTLTVEENILCVLENHPLSRLERQQKLENILEKTHLTRHREIRAQFLSGGEKKRLEIARILLLDPQLLLLDEPFANIDPITIQEVKGWIKRLSDQGITICISDHNARELSSIVDQSFLMVSGSIIARGTIEQLLHNPTAKKAYFGTQFSLQ